jgi:hypothetical protein
MLLCGEITFTNTSGAKGIKVFLAYLCFDLAFDSQLSSQAEKLIM